MSSSERLAIAWLVFASLSFAAPPLTTIDDVLYNADGTRYKGVAYIEWKSFTASDLSKIATSSATVQINEGVLRVQLVPTTGTVSAYYSVKYHSDSGAQFVETWAVPSSLTALRILDVRISSAPSAAGLSPPVLITDVLGLSAELGARLTKGPGFLTSRVAMINPAGTIDSVVGNLTDCVRVDGTSGACGTGAGSGGPQFVDAETPTGAVNSSNLVFTLANAPNPPESLLLYRNGLLLKRSLDYTALGITITFTAVATPQTNDVLLASYRLAGLASPIEAAGGALTASVNDPTAGEKAALAGTAGVASSTNRYVTNEDSRMADARSPLGHSLLSTGHSDTLPAPVVRGDLMAAQGSSPTTWRRLPLGFANRCLTSNGADVVWNTCLFTGYSQGSIPFVDAAGNLEQNNARLFWDNSNRRLGIGSSAPASTLYVHDAVATTGLTGLTVRAGQGQGTSPLQRWLDESGAELARVDFDGTINASVFHGASTTTRAAWRDAGTPTDPGSRSSGDAWFNSTGQTRKTQEAGQVHTVPQILCASTGLGTASTVITPLGSCTVPPALLAPGDRLEIQADYLHTGSAASFSAEIRWGSELLVARTADAADMGITARAATGVHSGGTSWSSQSWGTILPISAGMGNSNDAAASGVIIEFLGRMSAAGSDTVTLSNFSVIRYPAQSNP